MTKPEVILKQLEETLESIPDIELPPVTTPDFESRTRNYARTSTRIQVAARNIIGAVSGLLSSRTVSTPFRICSIGCGSGELDRAWLCKLKDQLPDLSVEYVGVDTNDKACAFAENNLGSLEFVDIKTYCQDIQDGLQEKKFDFILSISAFYFMKTPEKVLEVCKSLLVHKGVMVISLGEKKPLLEPFAIFWYRHFRYDVCFPPKLQRTLEKMELSFSVCIESYYLDLTDCLQNRFSKEDQKLVLGGLTQVNTFLYPPTIVDKCIEYLEMVCQDSMKVEAKTHFFVFHNV